MQTKKNKFLRFILIFIKRSKQASLVPSSVSIAFYALLSIFPFLILLGNLLPLFHITPDVVVDYLSILIPEALLPVAKPIVLSLLSGSSGGLLSVSTLTLLWASSRAINCLQNSMTAAYGIHSERNYIVRRFIGFVSVLLFLVLIGLLLFLFSFSDMLFSFLIPAMPWIEPLRDVIDNLRWPVVLVFVFFMLVLVYLIAPSAKVRFREAIPGALFATMVLLLLVQLFALYVRVATRSLSGYGALSTFFILMFWLEYSAMAVVVGALLNASIYEYRFGEDSLQSSKLDEWNLLLDDKLSNYAKKKLLALQTRHIDKKNTAQSHETTKDTKHKGEDNNE